MKPLEVLAMIEDALANGGFPFSVETDNMGSDYEKFRQMLYRENLSEEVGISREPDKGKIWFRLRRKEARYE